MTKLTSSVKPVYAGLIQKRQEVALRYIGGQNQSNNWKPIRASVPVRFMDLRTGMCRWPIGDPHNFETFRFCGCACAPAAVYCEPHKQLALTPSHARTTQPRAKPRVL
jgi:hypothetical protein